MSYLQRMTSIRIEVEARIEQARGNNVKSLVCSKDLKMDLRYRMVKCCVHCVLLHWMEAWLLKSQVMSKLSAFEMWTFGDTQSIMGEKVTNEEMLLSTQHTRESAFKIRKWKTACLVCLYIRRDANFTLNTES